MWPGFGENMRVLKWIVDRVHGHGRAVESPLGWMPRYEDICWKGLDFPRETLQRADGGQPRGPVSEDVSAHEEHFDRFYDRLPKEFVHERALLKYRVWRSPEVWELAPEH